MDSRRKRDYRGEPTNDTFGPWDRQAVVAVAKLGCCTAEQVSEFLGWTFPESADPCRKARNHLRKCFDLKYLDKRRVSRSQLAAEPDVSNLYGSAPDVFVLDAPGRKLALDLLGEALVDDAPEIHDKTLLAAHHLMIRDARVWLERAARASEGRHPGVLEWKVEKPLKGVQAVPDAYVRYGLGDRDFGLFVEADRGTMTSPDRWEDKVRKYAPLLSGEGTLVFEATGLTRARLLAVAPTPERRDWIWRAVEASASRHGIPPGRILVCSMDALRDTDLSKEYWIANGMDKAVPLVEKRLL